MSDGRRPPAWRPSFHAAVTVFRITRGIRDERTNGFAARMRRTAIRIPALLTRAAGRRTRRAAVDDLSASLDALAELERQIRICGVLGHAGMREQDRLVFQVTRVRSAIQAWLLSFARRAPPGIGSWLEPTPPGRTFPADDPGDSDRIFAVGMSASGWASPETTP